MATDLTNPKEMAELTADVRQQEEPFTERATELFRQQFGPEYRRLRSLAIESGDSHVTLNITLRCNFNPKSRSIEIITAPAAMQPKPRRRVSALP